MCLNAYLELLTQEVQLGVKCVDFDVVGFS